MELDGDRQHSQENKPFQPSKVTTYGQSSLSAKLVGLKARIWWLIILSLQAFLFIVSIGCLGSPTWMVQDAMKLEGGLMRCTSCPGHWQDGSYDEISGWACEENNFFKSQCPLFEDLRDGGAVYIFFELLALVGLFAWMFKVMLLLLERGCFPKLRWLPYTWPILSLLSHLLALAGWFGITGASYGSGCDDPSDDRANVCATHAASLSIFLLLFYAIVIALFLVPYCKFVSLTTPPKEQKGKSEGEGGFQPQKKEMEIPKMQPGGH